MHFSRSQHIHITNLEFIGCGGNRVQNVEDFAVKDTMFKGEGGSRTALELIGTAAHNYCQQHFCIQYNGVIQRMHIHTL